MGTYTGTYSADTITPDFVSAGVGRNPVGSTPSAAADTINGFGGNDILDGGGGGDTINGGDGADTIATSGSGSIVHGGADADNINFDNNGNEAYGDDGDDIISISYYLYPNDRDYHASGTSYLYGGSGNDKIDASTYSMLSFGDLSLFAYGEAGDDSLAATSYDWSIQGSIGMAEDFLYGGAGNDTYYVYEASDAAIENPGEGYDTVKIFETDYALGANLERLEDIGFGDGSAGGWTLTGNEQDNVILADTSSEVIGYVLNGVSGNDFIQGSMAGDTISGGNGNDTLYGKPLGENWDGNGDADTIHGGSGNDLIYGAGGDKDTWDGDDLLYGDDGNDRIFGSYGDDRMYGGTGADELGGQAGNDTMYGGTSKDKLGGGSGDDWLYGEADADVLSGRGGLDRLSGGPGNDIFDYDAVTDSKGAARDVIQDFAGAGAAAGDRIDLSTIDANTTVGGNQAFKFVGKAAFSGPGQVRVVASGADTLIQVNTDSNKAMVEMDILVKDGAATPTQWVAGDFIL